MRTPRLLSVALALTCLGGLSLLSGQAAQAAPAGVPSALITRPTAYASGSWTGHSAGIGDRTSYLYQDLVNGGHRFTFFVGTTGQARQLEKVTPGTVTLPTNLAGATVTASCFRVQGHVQNIGWQAVGSSAGTTGRGLQLEAIRIWSDCPGVSVSYQAHVSNIGWQSQKFEGATAGTVGSGLQMEALYIYVTMPDLSYIRDGYQGAERRVCEVFGRC